MIAEPARVPPPTALLRPPCGLTGLGALAKGSTTTITVAAFPSFGSEGRCATVTEDSKGTPPPSRNSSCPSVCTAKPGTSPGLPSRDAKFWCVTMALRSQAADCGEERRETTRLPCKASPHVVLAPTVMSRTLRPGTSQSSAIVEGRIPSSCHPTSRQCVACMAPEPPELKLPESASRVGHRSRPSQPTPPAAESEAPLASLEVPLEL
mmetsp:Transcript_68861/g.224352  ORF Transcript_68861/g.224352 Transcript_68861/m.224352 type:complete len:208 (-) Transcript_68861:2245-2868(-)